MAHYAYLKQLTCLRLYSFACINHHDCGICRHKCTVSILRKILMSRGIQNIDLDSVVLKTHDRSRHRNTTLTFDLHKVGRGCLLDLIRFNSSGNVNGSSEKQ